ncbi:hypothetical protein JH06_4751 [Blastocystis sp. subtype 4]|uniref:hypothetical protein n=1 Tax=Blastocystis sp. subtype 4 TaxID=944170 RepID=UPI000711E466|nr:hypothetical protein JH06_4751 [Blastocystis sp. subtype 4]KNB41740.1 hypothetical protein JH06_4751 [Blastocystis sp. subtype 4]|eukprot:XP_014525183.1 hypothetical protein JH06_4751 [Blastocystis sp. subtype 4]
MNQLQTVTNEDYQNRSEAYVQLISSRNKLKEIEEELSHLVEENPGVLTLSQIDSVKDSINKLDRELDLLKQVPQTPTEIQECENDSEPCKEDPFISSDTISKPQKSVESMTLEEMRECLGLTRLMNRERDENTEKRQQQQIVNEILESTLRMRNVGESLHDQIQESNAALDATQTMTDANIDAVNSHTKGMKELRSRSWWTIFRDLKYFILAAILFFICIIVIVFLRKSI